MKKKLLLLMLAAAMAVSTLTGCSSTSGSRTYVTDDDDDDDDEEDEESEEVTETETETETESETETETEEREAEREETEETEREGKEEEDINGWSKEKITPEDIAAFSKDANYFYNGAFPTIEDFRWYYDGVEYDDFEATYYFPFDRRTTELSDPDDISGDWKVCIWPDQYHEMKESDLIFARANISFSNGIPTMIIRYPDGDEQLFIGQSEYDPEHFVPWLEYEDADGKKDFGFYSFFTDNTGRQYGNCGIIVNGYGTDSMVGLVRP